MPIYEYLCSTCGQIFDHFWLSIKAAEEAVAPTCPHCGNSQTRRIVSSVAVLGSLGGLTPGEQAAADAQAERLARITPREQIARLQAAKREQTGQQTTG